MQEFQEDLVHFPVARNLFDERFEEKGEFPELTNQFEEPPGEKPNAIPVDTGQSISRKGAAEENLEEKALEKASYPHSEIAFKMETISPEKSKHTNFTSITAKLKCEIRSVPEILDPPKLYLIITVVGVTNPEASFRSLASIKPHLIFQIYISRNCYTSRNTFVTSYNTGRNSIPIPPKPNIFNCDIEMSSTARNPAQKVQIDGILMLHNNGSFQVIHEYREGVEWVSILLAAKYHRYGVDNDRRSMLIEKNLHQKVEAAIIDQDFGLPLEGYGAQERRYQTRVKAHALDSGEAENLLISAISTAGHILTVNKGYSWKISTVEAAGHVTNPSIPVGLQQIVHRVEVQLVVGTSDIGRGELNLKGLFQFMARNCSSLEYGLTIASNTCYLALLFADHNIAMDLIHWTCYLVIANMVFDNG